LPDPALADRVAALDWYHSIDLGDGLVTPGWFDLRGSAAKVPLPERLDGMRCLDVGTWDGFWAFELERRGAAEVVAVDILDPARWDWPPRERITGHGGGLAMLQAVKGAGEAFDVAREALGSRVERRDLSVYDLDPVDLGTSTSSSSARCCCTCATRPRARAPALGLRRRRGHRRHGRARALAALAAHAGGPHRGHRAAVVVAAQPRGARRDGRQRRASRSSTRPASTTSRAVPPIRAPPSATPRGAC
jgi:hypothetical protein